MLWCHRLFSSRGINLARQQCSLKLVWVFQWLDDVLTSWEFLKSRLSGIRSGTTIVRNEVWYWFLNLVGNGTTNWRTRTCHCPCFVYAFHTKAIISSSDSSTKLSEERHRVASSRFLLRAIILAEKTFPAVYLDQSFVLRFVTIATHSPEITNDLEIKKTESSHSFYWGARVILACEILCSNSRLQVGQGWENSQLGTFDNFWQERRMR